MFKHGAFDLMLHTDAELEAVLGESLAAREQVHGWPLSNVEKLTTASGVRWIYKSQHTPTFEPEFYEAARSPVLPAGRVLSREPPYAAMLFEFIDAPLLKDLSLPPAELARHGHALLDEIGGINADVPVYIDIGAWSRWQAFVGTTLEALSGLLADGKMALSLGPPFDAGEIEEWAASDPVRQVIETTSRLSHGDLNPGNVFVTEAGHKIIDWQRPQLAPAEVDLVWLLETTRAVFDFVPARTVGVAFLLRLFWAVEARGRLLPQLPGRLFDFWATDAINQIRQAYRLAN